MAGALQSPDLKTGRKGESRAACSAFYTFPASLCARSLPHPNPSEGLKQIGTPAPSRGEQGCLRALGTSLLGATCLLQPGAAMPCARGWPTAGDGGEGGCPLTPAAEIRGQTQHRRAAPESAMGHPLASVTRLPLSCPGQTQPCRGMASEPLRWPCSIFPPARCLQLPLPFAALA